MNTMMTMKCGNVRIQTQVNAEKENGTHQFIINKNKYQTTEHHNNTDITDTNTGR